MKQIMRLRRKLFTVRSKGWKAYLGKSLGVKKHKLQLGPPISRSQISHFEKQLDIRLPRPYANFLEQVGYGGAGPYYGLLTRDCWLDAFSVDTRGQIGERAAMPCLLTPDLPPEYPDWLVATGGENWEIKRLDGVWDPFQGTITICDQGCAYYALLIITGPYRGRICNVNLDLVFAPVFSPHLTFLDWYEGWLDALLSGEKIHWYGYPSD